MNFQLSIIAFALLVFSACKQENTNVLLNPTKSANNSLTLDKESLQNTKISPVALIADSDEFGVVGEISFDEDNVVRVYPIVSGSVENVNASLGDYVKKGQIIATLLSTDISQYQRDYNVAKTDVDIAQRNYTRSKELFETRSIAEKELIETERILENAKHEFNERKQILELYGGSALKNDAVFNLISPNSGYIVERNINQGTQIRTDNANPLFVISDLKTVWVWANVYESDLSKVKEGDEVKVSTIAYPDKVFAGRISRTGTVLDPQTRVMKVRTELSNGEGLLKPDMFATVYISPSKSNQILVVPTAAIVIENNRYWVMKAVQNNTFVKTEVTLGKVLGSNTQILSGLNAEEKVVSEGALFIQTAFNKNS